MLSLLSGGDVSLSPLGGDVCEGRQPARGGEKRRHLVCETADDKCDDTVRPSSGGAFRHTNRGDGVVVATLMLPWSHFPSFSIGCLQEAVEFRQVGATHCRTVPLDTAFETREHRDVTQPGDFRQWCRIL